MKENPLQESYEIFNKKYPISKDAFRSRIYKEIRYLGIPTRAQRKGRRDAWSQEEIEYLKELIQTRTQQQTAEEFRKRFSSRTETAVIAKAKDLHLKSNPQALKKQMEKFVENSKKTRFKKGVRSFNHDEVGTIKLRKHNKGTDYFWIKTQDTSTPSKDWELCQRYFYKKYHGEIPKGYKVVFLDGNQANFDKENLMIVTNEEFGKCQRNLGKSIEIGKASVLIAKIEVKVKELEKAKNRIKE